LSDSVSPSWGRRTKGTPGGVKSGVRRRLCGTQGLCALHARDGEMGVGCKAGRCMCPGQQQGVGETIVGWEKGEGGEAVCMTRGMIRREQPWEQRGGAVPRI